MRSLYITTKDGKTYEFPSEYVDQIMHYNDEHQNQIIKRLLTFNNVDFLLSNGQYPLAEDAGAKFENKTLQATRYAVKHQPNKDEIEKGAYFSRCCGGCNFEHEVCPVRESAKGDHSCSYKQEGLFRKKCPRLYHFTFDYVVHFVPADGTWGIFTEGPHLPPLPIAWFTTEELANQYCLMLRGKI